MISARRKSNANYENLMSDKVEKKVTKICYETRVGHQVGLKRFITLLKNIFNPTLLPTRVA